MLWKKKLGNFLDSRKRRRKDVLLKVDVGDGSEVFVRGGGVGVVREKVKRVCAEQESDLCNPALSCDEWINELVSK